MSRRPALRHVPGLDGLRGVAVAAVLLFHDQARLRGGYLGVDVFFVLSGFLITTLLLEEHRSSGRIDLKDFWLRRARRLVPALLSLMPAVAVYAKVLAKPAELASIRADALATLGYVANWRAILAHRSYWDMFLAPSPLEHTWSLAIEEQFYVLWPLVVVVLLARKAGVRAVLVASLGCAVASMIAMVVLHGHGSTTRVYLGTDTRGAAIVLGAALAASGVASFAGDRLPASLPAVRTRALGLGGLAAAALLAVAFVRLEGESDRLYRGGFWLVELATLLVIVTAVRVPESLLARALSVRPLVWLGQISYGLYLWHWPLFVVLTEERTGLRGLPLLALRLAVTLAVAAASDRWFERPIRTRGVSLGRWARPAIVLPASVALVLGIVLAATRDVGAQQEPRGALAYAPPPPPPPLPSAEIASGRPRTKVLVVGDSVGISLGGRMGWDGRYRDFDVVQRAVGDCSILEDLVPVRSMSGEPHGNPNCASSWTADARELAPDVFVVVIGGAYFSTVQSGGRWQRVCEKGWHDPYVKHLGDLLGEVAPIVKRRVVVLAAYPVGKWQNARRNAEVDCFDAILREAAEASGAEVVDLNPHVCPGRRCTLTSEGAPVRPDGLHFDGPGAEETSHWLLTQLGAPPR